MPLLQTAPITRTPQRKHARRDTTPIELPQPDETTPQLLAIPLATGEEAIIERADYERLMALGLSPAWTFNSGIVAATLRGWNDQTLAPVARAIMMAGFRERVRYVDRNQLNLVRPNLTLETGVRSNSKNKMLAELRRREKALGVAPLGSAPVERVR